MCMAEQRVTPQSWVSALLGVCEELFWGPRKDFYSIWVAAHELYTRAARRRRFYG
jgi:hypothetical protein